MEKDKYNKKYYEKNKEVILKKQKEYADRNKGKIRERLNKYYSTKHGKIMQIIQNIRKRCDNPTNKRFNCYGGRGIKNLISYNDISVLWDRDNASLMKCPSIDRINVNGNYEFNNCQFLEMEDNTKKDCMVQVFQSSIDGKLIKIFNSISDAEKEGFQRPNIIKCCKGLRRSHKGFVWSYKKGE